MGFQDLYQVGLEWITETFQEYIILSPEAWYLKLYKCTMVTFMILHILIIVSDFFHMRMCSMILSCPLPKGFLHNSAVHIPCQKPLATSIQITTPFWSCAEDYCPMGCDTVYRGRLKRWQISGNDLPDCTSTLLRRQYCENFRFCILYIFAFCILWHLFWSPSYLLT